jgi:hypothetical protein
MIAKKSKYLQQVALEAPTTGIRLVQSGDFVDSMESAAPDVRAERWAKEMQGADVVNAFHAKKSIQPAVLAADPSREKTKDDMGSQDPDTEWRRGELSLDDGLYDVVIAFTP